MRTTAPTSLSRRLTPPPVRQDFDRTAQTGQVLRLATELFGVMTAALVEVTPGGPRLQASWSRRACDPADAVAAARRLQDLGEASDGGNAPAGVLEEIEVEHGFRAVAPVMSPNGRVLGVLCLIDPDRRTLLSDLQRRLLAELAELSVVAFESGLDRATPAPSETLPSSADTALLSAADRYAEPIAVFDQDGRCLMRNSLFASLLGDGKAVPGDAAPSAIADARGCEAEWVREHLSRDAMPVGIYRVCRSDGAWICVEERRGPRGRSLLARIDAAEAYGGDLDGAALFERCPSPMFVFDRETRRMTAVNAAALAFYGWDRDAFLALPLETVGPFGQDPDHEDLGARRGFAEAERWLHRNRAGDVLPVAGRTAALTYRGRPSILVALTELVPAHGGAVAA